MLCPLCWRKTLCSESEFLSCPLCWRKALSLSLSFSCHVLCAEGKPSESESCHVLCAEGKPSGPEFLMSCPLCWRKALRVWVSHVMSFVLKESPQSLSFSFMSFVLKESPQSLSFSCHVLCAEGKPWDLGVWVLKLNDKLGKNTTEELAKTRIIQKKHWLLNLIRLELEREKAVLAYNCLSLPGNNWSICREN